jgi:hypothetical protein
VTNPLARKRAHAAEMSVSPLYRITRRRRIRGRQLVNFLCPPRPHHRNKLREIFVPLLLLGCILACLPYLAHICRGQPLLSVNDVKLDLLTFRQGFETLTLNCGVMDKEISSLVLGYEPKPLGIVEPLHCSLRHVRTPLFLKLVWQITNEENPYDTVVQDLILSTTTKSQQKCE